MTTFVPKLNTGNAPEFLGYSRSPSYGQVAAATSTAGSTAVKGIGDLIGEASRGFVAAKTSEIQDQIEKAVTPVRDQAGASLTPDNLEAMANPKAPQDPTDPTNPNVLGSGPSVPGPLASALDGIAKLKAASEGNIRPGSSSHYYSQVNTIVKQMKTQYPGFSDIIDSAAEKFTGFNAANALRQSAMKDLAAMATKQDAAQTKLMAEYDKRRGTLQIISGGQVPFSEFQKDPDKYMLAADTYDGKVQQLQNQSAQLDYEAKQGTASANAAVATYTNKGVFQVGTMFGSAIAHLQQQGIDLTKAGANASPQDWAALVANVHTLKLQAQNQIDQMATASLPNSGQSYASIIKDRQKLVDAQNTIMAPFAALEAAIGSKDVNTVNIASNIATMRSSQDYNRLVGQVPGVRALGAISKGAGPQLAADVFQATKGALLTPLTKAVMDTGWLNVAAEPDGKTPVPSISQQVSNVQGTHPRNEGGAIRATVQANLAMLSNKDHGIASRAASALFDDYTFFKNIDAREQPKVYQLLASKTQDILALNDPNTTQKYANWLQYFAPAVAKQAISDLSDASAYKGYNIQFDPKTMMFAANVNPAHQSQIMRGDRNHNEAAQAVFAVNNLGRTLAPVLRAQYGDQAPQQFLRVLEANGYNPNAPKNGGMLDVLGNAVVKTFKEGWQAGSNLGADALPSGLAPGSGMRLPGATESPELIQQDEIRKGQLSGKTSLNDTPTGNALLATIRKGEASGNYDSLFGFGSAKNLNLQKMTVAEVQQLQEAMQNAGMKSTAAGAYQFLKSTLGGLVKAGVVKPDDMFTAETQDKLAKVLLDRRGYQDYKSGKITKQQFIHNLSQEWASLPDVNGVSFYEGDGLNHATVKLPEVFKALEDDRTASNSDWNKTAGDNSGVAMPKPPAHWARTGEVTSPEEDKQLDQYQADTTKIVESQFKPDKSGRLQVPEGWQAPDGFRGTVVTPRGVIVSYPGVSRFRTYVK